MATILLESAKLTEYANDSKLVVTGVWMFSSVNGVVPDLVILLDGNFPELTNDVVDIKLSVDSVKIIDGFMVITDYIVGASECRIHGQFVHNPKILYGTSPAVYNGIAEGIESIWKGGNITFNIPTSTVKVAQMNEINIDYLIDLLRSVSPNSTFHFGFYNDIVQVPLTNFVTTLDLTEDTKGISIQVNESEGALSDPGLDHTEVEDQSTGNYSTIVLAENVSSVISDGSTLERNYLTSTRLLMKPRPGFLLIYDKADLIKIGDVVKFPMSSTNVVLLLVLGIKVVIENNEVTCSAEVIQID